MLGLIALAATPAWSAPSPGDLDPLLAGGVAQTSMAQRIEQITRPFLGAPYVLSPLGEGEGKDPDPRLRLDAFDCTTFVETAIAMAAARNASELNDILDAVRYRGKQASFGARRHLIDAQWVPDLIAAGILQDVTAEIGRDRTIAEKFILTHDRWKNRRVARDLELPFRAVPIGAYTVEWIPLDAIASLDIPPGVIMNVVREDVPWSPTRVSHQALVLKDPVTGKLIVRQASPVLKRVMDEPIERFVNRYMHPKVEKKWRPVGVSFFKIKG